MLEISSEKTVEGGGDSSFGGSKRMNCGTLFPANSGVIPVIVSKADRESGMPIKLIQSCIPMLILISTMFFFATAFGLIGLRIFQPETRSAWLVAAAGGTLGFMSVVLWRVWIPFSFSLSAWQPIDLFPTPLLLQADGISWPLAVSIAALSLASLLTATSRQVYVNSLAWVGVLALGGVGILAVTAGNPLTLLLVWTFLDLVELLVQLRSVKGRKGNEKVIISFSTRVFGMALVLWANIAGVRDGSIFDFGSMSSNSGLYLVAAATMRLGVFPLHLPYATGSFLQRILGTSLSLISAASSLVLLARIPAGSVEVYTAYGVIALAVIAALYGGWMWLRAPDELNGRPFWVISLASLAVVAALSGNPTGVVAWGCALVLIGGTLFLNAVHTRWQVRGLLVGLWGISSLPFSLTASAWLGRLGIFLPLVIAAQALMMAGFFRHVMRLPEQDGAQFQPAWTRVTYPAGIVLLIAIQIAISLFGWEGALKLGAWFQAVGTGLLAFGLIRAIPRFRFLNPMRADWVSSSSPSPLNWTSQVLWGVYRFLGRISQAVTEALEGEGGVMWSLLFVALFISILTQGSP